MPYSHLHDFSFHTHHQRPRGGRQLVPAQLGHGLGETVHPAFLVAPLPDLGGIDSPVTLGT